MLKKKIKIMLLILTLVLVLFNSSFVLAQAENEQEQSESKAVYINAQHLEYEDDKTILSGEITIRKNDTTIKAQNGELFREDDRMELKEDITVDYSDGSVVADLLTAFLNSEEYIFKNNVRLEYLLKDKKENMILNSNYLKIFGDSNSFEAEDSVVIDYEDKRFKGDNANYNADQEIMYLTGNVLIEEGDDWVKSNQAQFFLGEGEGGYTADGDVEIKMTLD